MTSIVYRTQNGTAMIMKRIFSMALTVAMLCSLNTTAFAASNETSSNAVNVAVMAESNSTIVGEYKEYTPFVVNNQEVRLYAEPVMTEEEALETYAAAFEMCAEKAEIYGITATLDNAEFVNFAKIFSFTVPANAVSASGAIDTTIDYYDYIETVLPRYLSTENTVKYGEIEVSDPIEIINGAEEHGRMFFITNDGSYIGQLAVTYSEGSFHSSFMFDSDEYIDAILSANTPFAVVAYEDDLVIKTAQDSKMLTVGELPDEINTYSLVRYSSVDFVTVDVETNAARELPSEEYYVSLAVPQVDNDTVNGVGLCWAAAVASVSNYRKDTSYDAMDIYNALDELYSGTPAGNATWYSRAYSYCNMSYTYTDPMEFVDLYDALDSKDRPVIFRVRRSENGSYIGHAVVLRYLCGGNEYTTYGFVDPNKTNTVYVDFYSPTCDPAEFEYYNGSRTYPDWVASIY